MAATKDFLLPQTLFGDKFPHHGVATLVAMLVTQALEDSNGSVALLLENFAIIEQDLINDADERAELR